ncbi:MAG TPA: right-handed parallel beta-helix repeat-containing protein, partial [Verrucomicrobiae bacterium]|nr:right-handed parallel beta-helix repeat-containing protein [Verrucomicrobiae bacterium]
PHVLITGCNVHGNRGSGIAGNGTVIGNTCAGNAGAGIFMSSSGGMVADNHVLRNYTGITLGNSSSTNLVIRNVAIGNTNGAFVISGSGNVVGPVINGAGAATNSNPGANYSL